MCMEFHESDVQNPVSGSGRITHGSSIVQFHPKDEDNFIKGLVMDRKVQTTKTGRSHVIAAGTEAMTSSTYWVWVAVRRVWRRSSIYMLECLWRR